MTPRSKSKYNTGRQKGWEGGVVGREREREREGDEGREKLVAGGKEKNNNKKKHNNREESWKISVAFSIDAVVYLPLLSRSCCQC